MNRKVFLTVLACFAVAAISKPAPCGAQKLWPVSFELNAGAGFGGSSTPHGPNGGFSADALVGFRPGARTSGGLVVAVSGSGQAPALHDASCVILPDGTCPPDFPVFWIISGLAGFETGQGAARFLVGPALAISSSTQVRAAQARLDLAQHLAGHFSIVASGRLAYVPNYRGRSYSLGAIGLGFRIR